MVRTPSIGSIGYAPEGDVPLDPLELQRYLRNEILRISNAINALAAGHLDMQTVAPAKPRNGDIRYADGTLWNPGSGVGIYYYKGATSSWVLLG